jgi:hypothetical protein
MNHDEALDINCQRNPVACPRWTWLCSRENPNARQRELYRREMIRLASTEFPSLVEQAGNAAAAVGRVVVAAATGKTIIVSAAERDRRQAICDSCEFYVRGRCAKCGCGGRKLDLTTESCPIEKW